MLIKFAIIFSLLLILGSLFSALVFMARDREISVRTARALTVRVVLSITLFLMLMLGYAVGIIR